MGKIKSISLFLLILGLNFSQAQEGFDKLKSDILAAEDEKSKLEGLVNLGSAYRRTQIDSIYYYVDSLSSPEFKNQEFAQVGKEVLEAIALYHQGDLQNSIEKFELLISSLETLDSKSLQLKCLNFLGIAYNRMREPSQSINALNKMLELIGDDQEYLEAKRAAHGNLSNAYKRMDDYADAIYHLEEVLALTDEDEIGPTGMAYLNMGQMLDRLQLYERAIDAYQYINIDSFPSESVKASVYSSMARAYQNLNNQDTAYYLFQKSYDIVQASGDWQQELKPLVEMASIEIDKGNFSSAEKYLNKANESINTHRFPPAGKIEYLITSLDLNLSKEDYNKAIIVGLELEKFANDNNIVQFTRDGFSLLSNAYEAIGNDEKALYYQRLYNDLRLSPEFIRDENRIKDQRTKLALLEKDQLIQEEASASEFYKSLTFRIIAVLVILIVVAVLVYKNYIKEKEEKLVKSGELEEVKKKLGELSSNRNEHLEYITLKSKAVIKLSKIKYIQSDGPYIEYHLIDKANPEIDRNSLKNLLSELPHQKFAQVHRSYIVNIDYVKSIYSTRLELKDGSEVSLSRSFKSDVLSILKKTA